MKRFGEIFLFGAVIMITVASCEKPGIITDNYCGESPEEETFNSTTISVRPANSVVAPCRVLLTSGERYKAETLCISSSGLMETETVFLDVDADLTEQYSVKTGIDFKPLPRSFYEIENDGIIELADNNPVYSIIKIYETNLVGNTLDPGRYLLPIVPRAKNNKVMNSTIYFDVIIREPFRGDATLYQGEDAFFVFYVNTANYDPRIVTDYYMSKYNMFEGMKMEYAAQIGHIINLKTSTIGYDPASERALFTLSSDLRYVLDNYDKYLLPIAETGRKICLSIEGGNTGTGFCNLSDTQIDDFASQVKRVVDYYNLDGINLWDKNSGYELDGAPQINTTSYPKLIRSLREFLGPDKLLTLTDYESPTEYFWDLDATGGISVGNFLDYAWSGYNNNMDGYQVVDPYNQGANGVSTLHARRPIAGLDSSKYGCINEAYVSSQTTDFAVILQSQGNLIDWAKNLRHNNIIVSDDIRTNLQDNLEGVYTGEIIRFLMLDSVFLGGRFDYAIDHSRLSLMGFNKWVKDW